MKEREWLSSDNPARMLSALENKLSARKLRLFACGCARLVWSLVDPGDVQNAVVVAERFVDGEATQRQLAAAYKKASKIIGRANSVALLTAESASAPFTPYLAIESMVCALDSVVLDAPDLDAAFTCENARQLQLVRCIFGNPFRPVKCNRKWRTDTVVALAQGIYDDRAFDRMPILADALQDAGCDSDDILDHCRDTGPHARGCWVVDLVLGKS